MTRNPFGLEDVLADRAVDETLLEVPLPTQIFRVFAGLGMVTVLAVGAQVLALSVGEHERYEARAEANIMDVRVEPAPRGVVRDRFGKALVTNVPSWSAVLIPRDLPADSTARDEVITRVAALIGEDAAALRSRIAAKDWSISDRLVLSDTLSQDAILTLSTEALPGIRLERSFARMPVHPFAYSHVLGYTGRVGSEDLARDPSLHPESVVGKTGVEAAYDRFLRGRDGKTVTYRNARGEEQSAPRYEAPTPGAEVRTTIDAELQEFIYERFTQALRELGRTAGAVLALDPRNGAIRALVSMPSFEPFAVVRYLKALGNPLFNRAIQGAYQPGSTIKPIVGVAALTEGVIQPEDQIFSGGFIEVPNPYNPARPSRFLDNQAHGWVDLRAALARSSNVYFYEVAGGFENQIGLGIERLKAWWARFGLGTVTGIDLPGERAGFLPDPTWKEAARGEPWRVGDTYHVAIGQGDLLVTPIGLLNAIAAIGNGGTIWRPYVVRAVVDGERVLFSREPEVLAELDQIARSALPEVREGMRDVVRAPYGTAHSLGALPIAVAAKTGTAQIEGNTKLNAFFVGFAPAENPELAILILVEDAREGSLNTVPVARDIFLWYYSERIERAPVVPLSF